jgi:hypothetical protein
MQPLDGIREKLKRADQNIRNLESEIAPFLARFPTFDYPVMVPGLDPVFTDEQREAWKKFGLEFREKERTEIIPLRFSVLAGEIIHHLRSCFDHLAWQLSDESCRQAGNNRFTIEFPIFDVDPTTDPDKARRYRGKVKCIINRPSALARIERLQPYKSSDPHNVPLWRLHNMDRTDKHRELTLVIFIPGARFESTGVRQSLIVKKAGIPIANIPLVGTRDLKVNTKISAYVAFGKAVKGEFEAVIQFLQRLHRFTLDSIESFADEFVGS